MRRRTSQRTFLVLIIISCIGLCIHAMLFHRYTVDDAYISFRYARHLAEGHGLVFNTGERVEGYTNFLWTLVHSLCIGAGFRPELFAKALALVSAVGTLFLILLLGNLWGHGRSAVATSGAFLWVVSGAVAVAAMAGLETHLFTLLVTLGVILYSWPIQSDRVLGGSLVAFSVATLVRPEGLFFLAVTLGHFYTYRSTRRHVLWPLLLPALVLIPHFAWKTLYYGSPFPNTLTAKTGGGFHQLERGFGYVKGFVNEYGKPALYLLAAIPFIRMPLGRQRSYAFALIASYVAYVMLAGGDWIPHYRFLIPIMPLIYVSVQDGLVFLWRNLPGYGRGKRRWPVVVFSLFLAVILFDIANQSYYLRLHTEMWADGYSSAHARVGHWLRANAQEDDTVALMDVGLIGYLSKIRILDITGLTDPHIAAAPGGFLKKEYPLDYLFQRDPTYVVLVSAADYPDQPFGSSFPIDRAIFQDPRFLEQYEFLFSHDAYVTRTPHISGYYLLVFQKKAHRHHA